MAVSKFEVNTGTLKGDVTSIQNEIGALKRAASKLRQTSGQLNSMWEGEAKGAFQNAVNDDLKKLDTLISAVEKYTKQTDEARTEYERCESAVSQIISSIRV